MANRVAKRSYVIYEAGEKMAYCRYMNKILANDPDCRPYLPIDPFNNELYDVIKNGIILIKLVNKSFRNSIDERAMHKNAIIFYPSQMIDNLLLAITVARCNGCPIIHINVTDIIQNTINSNCLILELLWEIIKCGFFHQINLFEHPELCNLKNLNEDANDLLCLSPENLLMRYVNFHLKYVGIDKQLMDIETELSDCIIYAHLLPAIAPITIRGRLLSSKQILADDSIQNRAKGVLQNLREMESDMFLCLTDFTDSKTNLEARGRLHLATIAYLFLNYPGELTNPRRLNNTVSTEPLNELVSRNFVNSFGINPYCTHICVNLRDGLVVKQLFEVLRPNCTIGLKFITEFDEDRKFAQFIHNNNNIVRLVLGYPLNLTNLDTEKLSKTDKSCCLSLLLEIIRAYITNDHYDEHELLKWTNDQLYRAGQTIELRSFNDRTIGENNLFGIVLNNLTNGMVEQKYLNSKKLENSAYCISVAQKVGYPIYTKPEHFASCNGAFVSLAFATLRWYTPHH